MQLFIFICARSTSSLCSATRAGSYADLVFLFETREQIVICDFCWIMIQFSCKVISWCYLSVCQVELFPVQLLLNTDDRNLSTFLPRPVEHVIMHYLHFFWLIRTVLINTQVTDWVSRQKPHFLYIGSHALAVQLMTPDSKNSLCHKAAFYFQHVVVVCSGHKTGLVAKHRWPKMVYNNQTKWL